MEFIKVNSKKLDYYFKSNKPVSGLLLNPSSSVPTLKESLNSNLNEMALFWGDEDYDEKTVGDGDYYMLIYSEANLNSKENITVIQKVDSSENLRILQTTSSTELYFSEYELDDNFEATSKWKWWIILLIILACVILLLLLILLICCCCCCCCGKKEKQKYEEPKVQTRNVQVVQYREKEEEAYEDGFLPPVMVKEGNSRVNNYINQETMRNGL